MNPPQHSAAPLPETLLTNFVSRRLARGSLVSTPHDPNDRILLLRQGRIRVFVASEERELTLAYLSPGELFSTHTRAFLRAESACELLALPTREFVRTMANEPGMLAMVMPVLGRILDNSIAIIEDLAFRDVAGRLARFLLLAARQQGSAVAPGAQVTLALSTQEMALMLGTSRQTVSSLLNQLEREAVIARPARGRLLLLRPGLLQDWLARGRPVGNMHKVSAG
ncbi:MAG: hypothetical protein BSR46_05505 [Candidatus Dactylopiibacterium carminicum]|nr:Crp/Fnr family transcriptional regulator [Candidatus Dactylopiibacterium carminicum]PAS99901.1 MAG: hypothetical protein BSR46_05505 [Candidatus Dactylopiibacterium carminicum]